MGAEDADQSITRKTVMVYQDQVMAGLKFSELTVERGTGRSSGFSGKQVSMLLSWIGMLINN